MKTMYSPRLWGRSVIVHVPLKVALSFDIVVCGPTAGRPKPLPLMRLVGMGAPIPRSAPLAPLIVLLRAGEKDHIALERQSPDESMS